MRRDSFPEELHKRVAAIVRVVPRSVKPVCKHDTVLHSPIQAQKNRVDPRGANPILD